MGDDVVTPAELVQNVLQTMAATLPIWRDGAIAILSGLVILGIALWLEAER